MGERHYTIAEIAKKVNVEPHLLRYWEDELALDIPRNERGLRYYRRQELMMFRAIQNLRTKGFRMGAIKMVLDDIYRVEDLPAEKLLELRDRIDEAMGVRSLNETFAYERVRLQEQPANGIEAGGRSSGEETLPEIAEESSAAQRERSEGEARLRQFRRLMTEIVYDAMKQNNEDMTRRINYTVSDSVIREMDHLLRRREEREEMHFRKIDQMLTSFRVENGEVAVTGEPVYDGEKKGRIRFPFLKKNEP